MDQTPFLVALRALGRVSIGLMPSSTDDHTLRESVSPREAKLPIEDLCYLILKRELNVPKKPRRSFGEPANRADPRIQSALDSLAAVGPWGKGSIKELALSVELSPSRFSHLFALATGLPPARYIKRAKRRSSHQSKPTDKK